MFQYQDLFADVILPVPIPQAFTYRVPQEMVAFIAKGARVVVPFGKGRILTGIVQDLKEKPPTKYTAKYINALLDETPIVSSHQLDFFQWMADYYMCNIGEVMQVALPAGLKVSSQSKIQMNPGFEDFEKLSEVEQEFLAVLQKQENLAFRDVKNFVVSGEEGKFIQKLIQKKAILLFEDSNEIFVPKKIKRVRLTTGFSSEKKVVELIDKLESKGKQLDVILKYLQYVSLEEITTQNEIGVEKLELAKGISTSSMNTLLKKGILEEYEVEVSRIDSMLEKVPFKEVILSAPQENAFTQILAHFEFLNTVLLRGITGSGKTEIYIKIIQTALENGSQVLLLLPEIALTTQIVSRLHAVFGKSMGVYHSKFSDNERVEVWKGVLSGEIQFVIGVRSALFLPFENLGLILVDEEHEPSFKQFDPAPRYHARDAAIMLAHKVGAKVLLGSATPSIESYYQAREGKYGLVELLERYGSAKLPAVELVNLKEWNAQNKVTNAFAEPVIEALGRNLQNQEQSIVFQNRRGYAPYLKCDECAHIVTCHQCSVSLTYHFREQQLVCHYCGYREDVPKRCPQCQSDKLKTVGTGTEKLEDDLQDIFPQAVLARMDFDTTRSKTGYQRIIEEMECGKIDILVGTQMLSKGLDFDKVSLVVVFDADKMIYFPDFRSAERAFQLITQVSGRAGRKDTAGNVLIQTNSPGHPLLNWIIDGDYNSFYANEIIEREKYHYPPFSRLIGIKVKHQVATLAHTVAGLLAQDLKLKLGELRILGPEKAIIERVRNQYIYEIWVKLEKKGLKVPAVKNWIQESILRVGSQKKFQSVRIVVDVDAL